MTTEEQPTTTEIAPPKRRRSRKLQGEYRAADAFGRELEKLPYASRYAWIAWLADKYLGKRL